MRFYDVRTGDDAETVPPSADPIELATPTPDDSDPLEVPDPRPTYRLTARLRRTQRRRPRDPARAAPRHLGVLGLLPLPIDSEKHLGDPKKAFARACHSARIEPGLVIHSLRHSYASHLVQSGQSLQVVQSLLGYRQIGTTARYAHLSADQLQQAASQVSLAMTDAMR